MAEHALGLDVGTSAVRVVEVCVDPKHSHGSDDRPTVRVFGQVPLPDGAARDGEVLDPAAVGEAIAGLWRETGLKAKDVRVGLASQRVVVRTVELPDMPEADLEGAVRFSAQDHIPIPLAEAMLDFAVLERFSAEGPPGTPPTPMVRVLIAAVHREPLDRLVSAAAAGGLRVVGVDLVPFALVRAFAGEPAGDGDLAPAEPAVLPDAVERHEPGGSPLLGASETNPAGVPSVFETGAGVLPEAIVSIGAGVTTVVVHEAGRPRFVRTVATGGQALTAAIVDELGVTIEAAEAAKLSGDPSDDLALRAARVVEPRLAAILGEIQGSLNYWMAQSDQPLGRVLLCGGAALTPDLGSRLSLLLGVPVELARARDRLDVQVEAAAEDIDPFLAVAAGLALGAVRTGHRRIDLNPVKPRTGLPSRRFLMAVGAGAAAVVVIFGGLAGAVGLSASQERSRLSAQQRENEAVEAELAKLDGVRRASSEIDAGRARLQAALAGDIAWTRILENLARTMPDQTWISTFSAQPATPGAAQAASAGGATGGGAVTFSASGLGYPAVASWLDELPVQPEFGGVSVGGMTKGGSGDEVVAFTSTAQLTPAAFSDRLQRLLGGGR